MNGVLVGGVNQLCSGPVRAFNVKGNVDVFCPHPPSTALYDQIKKFRNVGDGSLLNK